MLFKSLEKFVKLASMILYHHRPTHLTTVLVSLIEGSLHSVQGHQLRYFILRHTYNMRNIQDLYLQWRDLETCNY